MLNRKFTCLFTLLAILSGSIQAEPSLLGARIGAVDPPGLARFYQQVFGVIEVNRFTFPNGSIEVMLGFADSLEDFLASHKTEIVLFPRPADDVEDIIPHLIFQVDDLAASTQAVLAAGGSMETPEPIVIPAGNGSIRIVIGIDPVGNLFEMIQQP